MFIVQPFRVSGSSMEPNFYNNERVLIDKISPALSDYKRGESIVFFLPVEKEHLIKRIIGLPKERIVIQNRKISIYNAEHPKGLILDESKYSPRPLREESHNVTLGSDEYYVLGDNRPVSKDSEIFGPIKRNTITGRALFRFWPLNRLSLTLTQLN